jgi:hypothetical protein
MIMQASTDIHGPGDRIRLVRGENGCAPRAPCDLSEADIDPGILADLTLKAGYTVPSFSTDWAARRLHLPLALMQEILEHLRIDRLTEALGQDGPFGYRFAVTPRGRDRAVRLLETSGYVGPAPVSLAAYGAMLEWQLAALPPASPDDVRAALAGLVLPPEAVQLAGFAASSGRSLFLFGPPGNGKTTLSRCLHAALKSELWVPHCIAVEHNVIRVFDTQCHQRVDDPGIPSSQVDARWVRVRRPFIVVGGELTLDAFDLTYSPSVRYYEAPLHLKANGGLFLIDDFGRERIEPQQLINRWICPLEHQIDHLVLQTGQKIQVPLRLLLVLATNLSPETVTDAAFLRRLGYRLHLGQPGPEQYAQIFEEYAARQGSKVGPALLAGLLRRYRAEGRELRCCEPRDLIERARDISRFRDQPFELNEETLGLAWLAYFGNG